MYLHDKERHTVLGINPCSASTSTPASSLIRHHVASKLRSFGLFCSIPGKMTVEKMFACWAVK